jgi:hypothetical protein
MTPTCGMRVIWFCRTEGTCRRPPLSYSHGVGAAERCGLPTVCSMNALGCQWPEPGWSDQVAEQYRVEADVLRRQRSSVFENSEHYAADEVLVITGRV